MCVFSSSYARTLGFFSFRFLIIIMYVCTISQYLFVLEIKSYMSKLVLDLPRMTLNFLILMLLPSECWDTDVHSIGCAWGAENWTWCCKLSTLLAELQQGSTAKQTLAFTSCQHELQFRQFSFSFLLISLLLCILLSVCLCLSVCHFLSLFFSLFLIHTHVHTHSFYFV